jgi:acetylglutamate kinase
MEPPTDPHQMARMLAEALPYMNRYENKTIVVKYGGHAMGDEKVAADFGRDVALLKQVGVNPIVVHGGGPQIKQMLDRLKVKSEFVDGLRVTDAATVEIVEMVLSGAINKEIVATINRAGGRAVGLSGKDANFMVARKVQRTKKDPDSNIERVLDLGFVGEPWRIDPGFLEGLAKSDLVPVVAPIGVGENGETYNINADTAAGAIAGATRAERLLLLTDVPGVLDKDKKLIPQLTASRVKELIADGTISGGMIPKVETCLLAIERGAKGAIILDGRVRHSILMEVFTDQGVGTMIVGDG